MYVRHDHILDIGDDQFVVKLSSAFLNLENGLARCVAHNRWHLIVARKVGSEVLTGISAFKMLFRSNLLLCRGLQILL